MTSQQWDSAIENIHVKHELATNLLISLAIGIGKFNTVLRGGNQPLAARCNRVRET